MRNYAVYFLAGLAALTVASAENKYQDHGVILTGVPSKLEGFSNILTYEENFENFETSGIAKYSSGNPLINYMACDADYDNNLLYVYEYSNKRIEVIGDFNTSLVSTDFQNAVENIAEEYPRVKVDWVSNNIYWTDPLHNWIAMQPGGANTDKKYMKVLAHRHINLVRALDVDPIAGSVFFCDPISSVVERMTLTGAERTKIISDGLTSPLDIYADYGPQKLYILDRESITVIYYNGGGRDTLVVSSSVLFYDMAIFGNTLMATELYDETLNFFDKTTGEKMYTPYGRTTESFYAVCLYHSEMQQPVEGRDRCKNKACSHICVEEPTQATCLCGDGFELESDGLTCKEKEGLLLRTIVISLDHKLCWLSISILTEVHKMHTNPTCFYEGEEDDIITNMDLNMRTREIFFAIDNTIYSIPFNGDISKRRMITQQPHPIIGLSYDWVDDRLYFARKKDDNTSVEAIWTVQVGSKLAEEHKTNTSGQVKDVIVVPHEGRVMWIAGDNLIEYSDKGIHVDEIQILGVTDPFFDITKLIHDAKYETVHILDAGYGDLTTVYYNGTSVKYRFLDSEVLTFAVYKEFMIYVGYDEDDDESTLKSGDLGISPVQWMGIGQLNATGRVWNIKFVDLETLQPQYPSPCRNHNGGCAQSCFPKEDEAICECSLGYQLNTTDNKGCMSIPLRDDFVVVADVSNEEVLQSDLMDYNNVVGISAGTGGSPHGVLYDRDGDYVYWTSYYSGEIWRRNLNGSVVELFVDTGFYYDYPLYMAIDPSSGYIYATVEAYGSGWTIDSLIVAIDQSGMQSVLVESTGYIAAIALYPQKGLMFWADNKIGYQAIVKANMDGTDEENLIDEASDEDILVPHGLAIDYAGGSGTNERIYWSDSYYDKIFSIKLDGTDKALFLEIPKASIQTILLFNGYLHYCTEDKQHISKVNLRNVSDVSVIRSAAGIRQIQSFDIFMSSIPSSIPVSTACAAANHDCSHFCFPTPTGHSCGCNRGNELLADKKTCDNAPRCPNNLPYTEITENDSTCLRLTNNQCNYTCEDGYRKKSDALLVCTSETDEDENLLWDELEPCEEIFCPASIMNGYLDPNCTRSIGADCFNYTCARGHEKNPEVTELKCQADGSWLIPKTLCEEKCPPISSAEHHAQFIGTCGRDPNVECRVYCDDRYRFTSNTTKLTCMSGSRWNVNPLSLCELTRCPDYITNGLVNASCTRLIDAVCNYQCDDTFNPHPTVKLLTCKDNGAWEIDQSTALCTPQPPVAEEKTDVVPIVVGVVVGVVVLILIVVVVVAYMCRRGRLQYSPSGKAASSVPPVSFENRGYGNNSVDGEAAGGTSDIGYSTLDDDKADLTKDSWTRTMGEQGTLHVYDNPTSIVQP